MNSITYNYEMKTNRIKEIREKKGLTQKELAKIVNIKASNLSNYENLKENIPIIAFNNICNYLEISFDYALNLSDKNNFEKNNLDLNKTLIGKRLKELREKNKLYQETLAMEIGTSKSLICEYEKGKKLLSLPYAYTICKKYHISADYLYGKTDTNSYKNS